MDDILRTALDALIIYLATLVMVRLGAKRFMGKNTAFDMIMGIMIGSVASRAINGSAEILPTIAGVLVLVLLHWLFAILAFHSDRFGTLIKGEARHLIQNGEKQADAIRGGHISQHDLLEAIRMQGNVETLEEVRSA